MKKEYLDGLKEITGLCRFVKKMAIKEDQKPVINTMDKFMAEIDQMTLKYKAGLESAPFKSENIPANMAPAKKDLGSGDMPISAVNLSELDTDASGEISIKHSRELKN